MNPMYRRVVAMQAALIVIALGAPAAMASPSFHVDELRLAGERTSANSGQAGGVAPAPCSDSAHRELGGTWLGGSYSWAFHASSTPSYLARADVRAVLRRSFTNITSARNDCGMPDKVSATHSFLGATGTRARCGRRDFQNVIGFGRLEFGVLAVTCYWRANGRIVEADIRINSRERWSLSMSDCVHELMLEAVITHEAGHVFGLDHVGEGKHGRLTMSPFLDGPCQLNEVTLGRGDVLGLEALY
ncbi:MAG: matrixin family metalloprotease [Candidatus Limnocylindrales bacterium]